MMAENLHRIMAQQFQGQNGHGTGQQQAPHQHLPNSGCQNCSKAVERFPKFSLLKGEAIGSPGGFGCVIKGTLTSPNCKQGAPTEVVVKVLHGVVGAKRYSVLQEMFNLSQRNLISFIGIIDNDPNDCPQLIFHPANFGNLLDYVKNISGSVTYEKDGEILNKISSDVVNGMDYLHSRNFIHGCLSARNVLLEQSKNQLYINAKISDYGMNRLITGVGVNYFNYTTGKSIPIRWLPSECIPVDKAHPGEVIKPSDVWSFGVLLYEVWTKGDIPYGPYGTVTNLEVKQFILKGSNPLAFRRPDNSGDSIKFIMENIFVPDPDQRPTFEILKQMFETIVGTSTNSKGQNKKTSLDDQSRSHAGQRGGRGRCRGRGGRGAGAAKSESNESGHNYESGYHANNAQSAIKAKRDDFKAHAFPNGHQNKRKPNTHPYRKVERGQDPKNQSHSRGGMAPSAPRREFPDRPHKQPLLPTPPSYQSLQHSGPTPLFAHQQQFSSNEYEFAGPPPPYSERPIPGINVFNSSKPSQSRKINDSAELQKTVTELSEKVKAMAMQSKPTVTQDQTNNQQRKQQFSNEKKAVVINENKSVSKIQKVETKPAIVEEDPLKKLAAWQAKREEEKRAAIEANEKKRKEAAQSKQNEEELNAMEIYRKKKEAVLQAQKELEEFEKFEMSKKLGDPELPVVKNADHSQPKNSSSASNKTRDFYFGFETKAENPNKANTTNQGQTQSSARPLAPATTATRNSNFPPHTNDEKSVGISASTEKAFWLDVSSSSKSSNDSLRSRSSFDSGANIDYSKIPESTTCPHLKQAGKLPKHVNYSDPCQNCHNLSDNYICLYCFKVLCGRLVNQCMLNHYVEKRHPLVFSVKNKLTWCYACDSYVRNPMEDVDKKSFSGPTVASTTKDNIGVVLASSRNIQPRPIVGNSSSATAAISRNASSVQPRSTDRVTYDELREQILRRNQPTTQPIRQLNRTYDNQSPLNFSSGSTPSARPRTVPVANIQSVSKPETRNNGNKDNCSSEEDTLTSELRLQKQHELSTLKYILQKYSKK